MAFANAAARPRSSERYSLSSIGNHISESLTDVNSFSHIHHVSDLLFNGRMKTIGEIRRIRLEQLVQETKSKTLEEVSELSGASPGYLSQVRNMLPDSKTGKPKEMGKAVAEKLRAGFQKPIGWMDTLDALPEESNIKNRNRRLGEVPKISWVKAGDLCDVIDFLEPGDAKNWLICPVKHGPRTFVLQVDGPSMDSGDREGYPDGYDIFVDPDVEPGNGHDVVVRTPDGRATFKRLQINNEGKFLLALNPDWPNRITPVPEGTVICGVVIYSGRPRM
jgi:SOS-response transcriptional repressor LexA